MYVLRANETHGILLSIFYNLKIAQGCEGLKKQLYVSGLSSAFAQHRAEFQVECLRAIGNPKMYKLSQQFFSLPRVRKEDRRWSNHEVFTSPQQHTATPLHPLRGLITGSSRTPCGTFHPPSSTTVRPRTQANNGDTGLGRNDDTAPNRHTSSSYFQSRSVPMNISLKI